MNTVWLLCLFLLGVLIGALMVAIYYQNKLAGQLETQRHYQALLQKQMAQSDALMRPGLDVLATNGELQQQTLQIWQERLLISLN